MTLAEELREAANNIERESGKKLALKLADDIEAIGMNSVESLLYCCGYMAGVNERIAELEEEVANLRLEQPRVRH